MGRKISRRDVLRGTAATAAGFAMSKVEGATGKRREKPAVATVNTENRYLRFGIIGCGGMGWGDMQAAHEHGPIVAIADVDAVHRAKAMEEHPRASCFDDYRVMLKAMEGKLDAVIVATPDHHHAPAAAMAMRMGLHCYCEKPLTRTIWEARRLAEIAREEGVATQMGNQSTSYTPMRKTAALIRRGEFGAVKEVHVWTDRAGGWWPQGVDRPAADTAPKPLDFDVWVGPSPNRPFAQGYHPFVWRGWWDFGTGALGDMGCHIFNVPFMALDLRDPLSVQAETSGHNKESFPTWSIVHYKFGERNGRAPLDLFWYDGGKRPVASLVPGFEVGGNGVIVVCEKATVFCPNELNAEFHLVGGGTLPDIEIEESPGHMAEFVRAALGGKPAVANIPGYAAPLTETVLLGNLAIWANGPKLEWDAKRMKVKGTDEFDALLRPKYRPGWSA